jgi:CBS domain-containing protein
LTEATVEGLMTKGVFTLTAPDPLREALQTFATRDIGTVVIVEDHRPVGILTERDVVRAVARDAAVLTGAVREIMSAPVVTVSPSTDVSTALRLMVEKRIRRLPVTQGGQLVGIVTARDLLRWMLSEVSPRHRLKYLTPDELARVLSGWE